MDHTDGQSSVEAVAQRDGERERDIHDVDDVVGDRDRDRDADSDDESVASDPDQITAHEARLEQRYATAAALKDHAPRDELLNVAFKLVDNLIAQYKLNRAEEILQHIAQDCALTDIHKDAADAAAPPDAAVAERVRYHLKHVQALAFCRWKQYRFREALELFLEQERMIGASANLYENIGHTYSSLGELDKAADYFERSLAILETNNVDGNKGGVLMGLGLVKDRSSKTEEALPLLRQALEFYQRRTAASPKTDSSIVAKAHMAVGKALEKLTRLEEADDQVDSALRIFTKTVGDSSPLTANALGTLGRIRVARGMKPEGAELSRRALELEVGKDAFHLETVWELLTLLKDVYTKLSQSRSARETSHPARLRVLGEVFAPLLPLMQSADVRIKALARSEEGISDIGTTAVFYKTAGEAALMAQDYDRGRAYLRTAIDYFDKVRGFDCGSLKSGCRELLRIAEMNSPTKGR